MLLGWVSADRLFQNGKKEKFQTHVFFQLDFGGEVITSELYDIFYDETIME